jgi:hypothetical protein
MKKLETSAKIKIEIETFPKGIYDLLEVIFWKEPELAGIALDFLDHIKRWDRKGAAYKVTEWESYCIRKNLSQSSYHNMLKRLRRVGLVKKVYNKNRKVHELKLSQDFSNYLFSLERIWDDFYKS